MSTTIRVSEPTRDRFASIAKATGRPMSQLLDEAADALERRIFFERLGAGYERLRRSPETWAEVQAERDAESGSLRDSSS